MLTRLTRRHGPALADFLADFGRAAEERIPAYFEPWSDPIETVVASLDARHRGEVPAEQVPGTVYFWEEDDALLGVLSLRHRLNQRLRFFGGHIGYSVRPSARRRGLATRMLAAALVEARARGIEGALLTCAPDNIGSIRAIERNGGVLEAEAYFPPEDRVVRRYWIGKPSAADLALAKGAPWS